ncbi:MAG: hypothetical protein ACXW11_09520 [Methylotenera sp.]
MDSNHNDNSIVSNPLFGRIIGQQIGNNLHAEADQIRANAKQIVSDSEIRLLNRTVDALRKKVESVSQSQVDLYAAIAGVRGVTRELLEELRKSDPNNPLLDKKIRDRVFTSTSNRIGNKVSGTTYQQRKEFSQGWRDDAYGAEGANKSGPEKSQITPNIAVRAEAEVPSHVSDREKFLGLIAKLAADLKLANPNAVSLQDQALAELSGNLINRY